MGQWFNPWKSYPKFDVGFVRPTKRRGKLNPALRGTGNVKEPLFLIQFCIETEASYFNHTIFHNKANDSAERRL